jgi:ribosomal protein L37AE/L43A
LNIVLKFFYSLLPNFKQYSVPTKEELNSLEEGSEYLFECDLCKEEIIHIKQSNDSWKCTKCGIQEINFNQELTNR